MSPPRRVISLTGKGESRLSGTSAGGAAAKRVAGSSPSPRRSMRCRRGCGRPAGCAGRSLLLSAMRAAAWPRPPTASGCRGRPRMRRALGGGRQPWVRGTAGPRRGRPRWTFSVEDKRWVRIDAYDTGFVDLAGDQGLLGQVEGRTSAAVVQWLRARTPAFREAIRYVAIDPAAVYAKAIRTAGLLPNATLVVDHFHLVKLANDCLTKVRRRTIWEQQGRRGRKIDPAWANRRRLLTAKERLTPKAFAAMWNSLIDSDPS